MRKISIGVAGLCTFMLAGPLAAQQIEHGTFVQRGWLNSRVAIEPISIVNSNGSQIKGMHRVGITVFNVAFPDEFTMAAKGHGMSLNLISASSSKIHTRLTGVDLATRQKIADAVYADFVTQLKAAGFEVVDGPALAAAAPELASWTSLPNGSTGRFGTYIAPTGMAVRPMPGDKAQRATNGFMGQQMLAFRTLDRTQAYQRSAYVAHDADVTAIAVTMVIDYGVYSSSGNRKGFGKKVSTGFEEGATVAAGTALDNATVVRVWSPNSGGFPTQMTLQQPVISDVDIGPADGVAGDWTIKSSGAAFAPPAVEVAERANGAIVTALLQGR